VFTLGAGCEDVSRLSVIVVRAVGNPEDIAAAIAWVASDEASFV
jgi:NAD(P)-dependent dehydrogenase (short-subunit alcohol dehydrogenase family)